MTREEALQHLLKFTEDNKYKSDEMGFLSGLIRVALRSPWHKASEELPKEDDVYYVAGVGFYDKANWCKGEWRNYPAPITHWMEIPEIKED